MWIWITCLVVLVICFIIAWRMLMSSYNLNNTDEKKFRLFGSLSPSDISFYTETIKSMRSKLKSLEDRGEYYENQIEKLNKKIKSFEKTPAVFPQQNGYHGFKDEEEDWKELYYAENNKKEKLENELDASHQEIEFLEEQLVEIKTRLEKATEAQIINKNREEEVQSLHKTIGDLQKGIEEAAHLQALFEKQKNQLEETSQSLKTIRAEKEALERKLQTQNQLEETLKTYQSFKSENEDLKNKLHEMNARQLQITEKINQVNNLESRLQSLSEEKVSAEKKLAASILENQKLQQLLQHETELKRHFEETANSLVTVRNENEGLQRQIAEMASRQSEIEGKILYINELENKVSKFEEDKLKMIADLEMLLSQSRFNHS